MSKTVAEISNFSLPSKLVEVDVGSNGDYTGPDQGVFTIVSCGDGGDIVVRGELDDTDVTLPDTPAGQPYPVLIKQITASGTSPNNIVVGFFQG